MRQRASQVGFGIDLAPRDRAAKDDTPEERKREFEERWKKGGFGFLGAYNDIVLDEVANQSAQEFVREKIRAVVKDPKVAELLTPKTTIGCKRLCLDTNYFETFNRPNVTLDRRLAVADRGDHRRRRARRRQGVRGRLRWCSPPDSTP